MTMIELDSLSDDEALLLAKGIDNPLIQSMARLLDNVMQITEERKRYARLRPDQTVIHGTPQTNGNI